VLIKFFVFFGLGATGTIVLVLWRAAFGFAVPPTLKRLANAPAGVNQKADSFRL